MLGRIIKRDAAVLMHPPVGEVSGAQQGGAHGAMTDHQRDFHPLLLGEAEKPRRQLAHHVAIEGDVVRGPDAVEDNKQQQRIFGRLAERVGAFNQQTGLLFGRLSFRSGKSFGVDERGDDGDLELDLFPAQSRRRRQRCDLIERAPDLFGGLDQRGALERSLSSLAPR